MKSVLLTIVVSALTLYSFAQPSPKNGPGKVTGRVIDSASKQPVEYATITVIEKGNAKPVSGAVTDAKGNFAIDNLPTGNFQLSIDFIGYQSKSLPLVVSSKSSFITVNTVSLQNSSSVLTGITVTTSRPLIENKIDKLVYNVDKDISSQGGVATDVLKKVPQVTVDINGNVELQGSSSIRFLINGKPSSIFGNSLADALQSIPASQIQSIEVITSPGAKYDVQGTGGIINIILKKSQVKGINGNINASAGTRLENGSFNLNYRHNNFGMNAYFSGNAQLLSTTNSQLSRHSIDTLNKKTTDLLQNGTSDFTRNGFQTGIGFDWSLSKRDNFTGSLSYNHFSNHNKGLTNQQSIDNDFSGNQLSNVYTLRNADSRFDFHSIDWSLNYKKTFKKENQELNVLYSTTYGTNTSFYSQDQSFLASPSPFTGSYSNNPGKDNETNISIDYTHPVSETFTLETGVKNIRYTINSIANVFTLQPSSETYSLDTAQSYALNYKRNVYAYYLSGSFSLLHFFDIKAGARYEYTTSNAFYSNAHNVAIPSYSTFAPSIVMAHKLSDNQTIKLSYTYRIERPDYRDLNPFYNLSDPHNITTGNPSLQPEIGNNYELNYNKSFEKGANINVSVFYRKNTHDIKNYITYYPSLRIGDSVYYDVNLSTRENIGVEDRVGLSFFGSVPVNSKLNLRTNMMVSNRHIVNNFLAGATSGGIEYRINLNASYQFNNDLAFEAFGNYNSPMKNIQGTQPGFVFYNMAVRQQLFNKKASIAFTTTNPFNKYVNQRSELTGPNFTLSSLRQFPLRSFGLNFTYKFGKLEFKKSKEEDAGNQVAPF